MIWIIFAFILTAVFGQQCPSNLKNELELISLPLSASTSSTLLPPTTGTKFLE